MYSKEAMLAANQGVVDWVNTAHEGEIYLTLNDADGEGAYFLLLSGSVNSETAEASWPVSTEDYGVFRSFTPTKAVFEFLDIETGSVVPVVELPVVEGTEPQPGYAVISSATLTAGQDIGLVGNAVVLPGYEGS